jgi:hypothetical protein
MKALIAIVAVVVVCFGAYKVWEYWDQTGQERAAKQSATATSLDPTRLPGLDPKYESLLQAAQREGSAGLKRWLDAYKSSGVAKDPRLAWIELDYVMMVSTENPIEAKKVFARVKSRTAADSPVYPRIKALEKTYE